MHPLFSINASSSVCLIALHIMWCRWCSGSRSHLTHTANISSLQFVTREGFLWLIWLSPTVPKNICLRIIDDSKLPAGVNVCECESMIPCDGALTFPWSKLNSAILKAGIGSTSHNSRINKVFMKDGWMDCVKYCTHQPIGPFSWHMHMHYVPNFHLCVCVSGICVRHS